MANSLRLSRAQIAKFVGNDPEAIKQLERILTQIEIEPTWAAAIADWIDPDDEPGFPEPPRTLAFLETSP